MKKVLIVLFTMLMCVSSVTFAADENLPLLISTRRDTIMVMQDGKYVDFTDSNGNVVEPQIINDSTMVPFRKIFNSLGVSDENITWIADTRTIIAKNGNVEIELQIDNNIAKKTVSGEVENITLLSAPVIVNDRTLVPVRFIAESMEKLVGWDSQNRTVIIIDMNKLQNDLENAIPKYMELVNSQTETINTFEGNIDLDCEIVYKDSSDKSNNTNLKLDGEVLVKKSESAIAIDLNAKFSGKGSLYDAIKKNNLTKIDMDVIINEKGTYVYSSLLDVSTDGKWIYTEDEIMPRSFEALLAPQGNYKDVNLLAVNEEELTIETYAQLQAAIELLEKLFGDDNIKITGSKVKKYVVEINMEDFISFLSSAGYTTDNMELAQNMTLKLTGTIENGVVNKAKIEMTFEIEEGKESIKLDLTADSKITKYNKNVKIDIPSKNEIADI